MTFLPPTLPLAPLIARPAHRLVEMVIDGSRQRRRDALDGREIRHAGATDAARRSEGPQQGLLAARPDARNLVQRIGAQALRPLGPVAADGEAVRLVPQPLDVIQHRIARIEHERGLARHVDALAAGVAVRPLGDAGKLQPADAELLEHAARRRQLSLAAVDEHQVGPLRVLPGFVTSHRAPRCARSRAPAGQSAASEPRASWRSRLPEPCRRSAC
jgi:hypothetical protein